MKIASHGAWERYTPKNIPDGAPENTMFARRIGDGVDWYVYVANAKSFQDASIKLTVVNGIVGAATPDATMLFPGGATVLEISDVAVDDAQKVFGSKVYNADRQTFEPQPAPPPGPDLDSIIRRLAVLEGKAAPQ